MSIKEAIKEALNEFEAVTNITYYYLKRGDSSNCVVYTYTEYPKSSADGIEVTTEYDIYLNLILKDNLDRNTDILKNILKDNKFKKIIINNPQAVEDNGSNLYEITMNYRKNISNERQVI